ncbi:MAG: HD domain-containing protein [bacterium]|jgi:putative nucleotidyltransferase with HDIG domain
MTENTDCKTEDCSNKVTLSTGNLKQLQLAKEFLGRFHVLIRLAKTYDRYNSAVSDSAEALFAIAGDLLNEADTVQFDIQNDCVFFNRNRVKATVSGFNTLKYFVDEMSARGVRSMSIDEIAEVDDFLSFGMVFARLDSSHRNPFDELVRLMNLEGIAGIEVRRMPGAEDGEGDAALATGPTKEDAKRSFISALHIVKEALKDGVSRGKVNPRKVKRVVENVVDSILSNEESMLTLTAIRDYDEYTYHHSFNVCIYSIALGNRLGLPRQALCDLGIAALFHDVGKMDVPREVLNKTQDLTDDDWDVMRGHTTSGVKVLTYLKKLDRTILRSMIVTFCHHLNLDRSGYPATQRSIRPDAFSRIVRIADIYDALTSARSYRMKPFSKAKALAIIADKAGRELDPVLSSIFIEVIGVIPEGAEDNPGEVRSGARKPAPAETPELDPSEAPGQEEPAQQ